MNYKGGSFRMKHLDIVVFGASGFTGKFVIREIVNMAKEKGNLQWGVAGRNETKLKKVLQAVTHKTGENVTMVPVIIADASDEKALSQMASKARVIINCVGPFNFYGEAVVKACIKHRTHLIDITGEIKYMQTMRLEYDEIAAEKGIYIVNACGVVSIPIDIGILHLLDHFGGEVNTLESYLVPEAIADLQGSVTNYGTWESYVYDASFAGEMKPQHEKPLPNLTPKIKQRSFLHKSDVANAWCLPFISSDNAVANWSQQYFYENEKKRPIQIQSYIGFRQLWVTLIFALVSMLFAIMTKTSFTRKLLLKYPKAFSCGLVNRELPEENVVVSFTTILYGEGWTKQETTPEGSSKPPNKAMVTKISSKYTGYSLTGITSVLAAVTILKEAHKMPGKGGVFTPATAFATTSLQQELASHGIKFEVISTKVMK